jgi:hypothetical protein
VKCPIWEERHIFSEKPSSGRKRDFQNAIIKEMEVSFKTALNTLKALWGQHFECIF